jgi:hypothetical protein
MKKAPTRPSARDFEVKSYSYGVNNNGTYGSGASSKTTKPVSSSTGPTKPTLPSSGGRHQ